MIPADKPEPGALCMACEGKPAPENNPCAVCGASTPEPVQAEPVACPECGRLAGEESDLLTIAYMSGVYDERKARENGLRPTSDLAERIEGLVGALEEWMFRYYWRGEGMNTEQARIYAKTQLGIALAALKEVNSHDRT